MIRPCGLGVVATGKCLGKAPWGNILHANFVDYYAANAYIMVAPKNTTALEGTRVRLVCQAEAHPNNITYQWFRDGVDVHLVTGLMARAGIYGDGSFIISSVQRSDTGWYRCQPTNGLGPPPSADAFLNVTCKFACLLNARLRELRATVKYKKCF